MNCPNCGYEFDASHGLQCPRCGEAMGCSSITCSECDACGGILGPIRRVVRSRSDDE